MTQIVIYSLSFVFLTLAIVVYLLWRKIQKIQHQLHDIEEIQHCQSKDVAGLCSAAVIMDNRVTSNDQQLQEMNARIDEQQEHPLNTSQPSHSDEYQDAIEQIHQGADAQELVKNYGLSVEEADLLTRLHK